MISSPQERTARFADCTKEQIRRIYALGAAAGLLDRSAGNDDNLHLWVKQFSLKDHISELTEQQADFIIRRLEEYRSQVAPLPELITEETDFTDHKNDTTAHVTADEKGSWNAKAELSDIPTTLPANGGNADISKYIGTWGAPEQYYGSRLKARILFNKFGDSRLGLTTDTNNEIRVDYATNADTLDGKHAEDFINVSATRKLETSINGTLGGTYFCEGSFTPDYPLKADGTEYGHYGLLDVRIYGSICYQTLQFENGIVLHRACVIGSTPWSDWMNINDGGNADTLDGLHANEIASNPNLLLNPDFRVNQRGQAEYTSGYTVDRWYSPGKCSAAPISGGVKLTSTVTASSTTHAFWQDFEFPLRPGKYTLSLKAADVTGVWAARIRTVTAAGDYVDS